jgi:ATP-binding cassette, subfamily B, bacterial
MAKQLHNYKITYTHLWQTYGQSNFVRISYILRILLNACKLILLPFAVSLIITNLSQQNYPAAMQAVFLYVGASLAMGVLAPLIKYLGMLGENSVYDQSTSQYFAKLVSSDIDYFNSNLSGYLTSATRQYVDTAILLTRAIRDTYIPTILSIVFPLVIILFLDPFIGLIALCLSIFQTAYLIFASHWINPFRIESREIYKKNSGIISDIISNILAVKSTAQEKHYIKKVRHGANTEAKIFTKRYTIQTYLIAIREFITVIFFLVLLWLTVHRLSSNIITLQVAILIINYVVTIMNGVYTLSSDFDQHDDYIDKILPAFSILDTHNQITDPSNPVTIKRLLGNIEFKWVDFSYEKGSSSNQVLHQFNLTIPAGQKLGIIGLSGAGKSTLAKLLLRFNDVDKGKITVDNIDIRHILQSDLRSQFSYVPQEPLLFHASILDNVKVSHPEASEQEVITALKTAHAFNFVQTLPQKMHSIVGERGVKLSGGQKQRIAIARAVLRHNPIIILDEATSALDSESEQIIKDSFSQVLQNKTAIVIAHRLSTLSAMDRIIIIEGGRVAEDGTHQELIQKKGIYSKLWERQQHHLD